MEGWIVIRWSDIREVPPTGSCQVDQTLEEFCDKDILGVFMSPISHSKDTGLQEKSLNRGDTLRPMVPAQEPVATHFQGVWYNLPPFLLTYT